MVLWLTLLCLLAEPPAKSRLVVLDLKAHGVASDLTASLNDALIAAVRAKAQAYDVLGSSEVTTLLGVEEQKQRLGCDTQQASCLAEIGGALGAERLVVAGLDSVGTSYFLDLKLMDVRHARVVGESSTTLPHDDDRLLKAIAAAAAEIFAPSTAPAAAPRLEATAPETAPARTSPSPPAVPTSAAPAPATDLEGWSNRHPEAARDLGGWVTGHPGAAREMFAWDRKHPARVKAFIDWAVANPSEQIGAFFAPHPDWTMGPFLDGHAEATSTLLRWVRQHPEAATDLMTHPRGLIWAGNHLYPGDWQSSAKRRPAKGSAAAVGDSEP